MMSLWLSSCSSEPPITTGKVVDKSFEPAHWEGGYEYFTTYGYHCGLGYDGKYGCGLKSYEDSRWEDQHTWHNDSYRIQLQSCEENDKGELKCRTGWRTITELEYDRYDIGNHYPNPH